MKNNMNERTIGLLGKLPFQSLKNSTVCVIGLGGVGGTCFESLVRSGVQHIVAVDYDSVDVSNLNRQILYTNNDLNRKKVNIAKNRAYSINPNIDFEGLNLKISESNISKLNNYKIDFIVDAIDDVNGKISIAKYALERNIPLLVSLGMANKLDPTQVSIIRLDKTTNDPLAKKLRHEYKKSGIDTKKIICAFSNEKPISDGKKLNSMIMVPSSAGLSIAYYVIHFLSEK
ncbi:MAG: tRNA threonylcarbamoyladenosine dehydratase [Bacilli bacterium]|nr:tRNA threonylcarbamoyladenosine dehydratase [Bacilli bacterium]